MKLGILKHEHGLSAKPVAEVDITSQSTYHKTTFTLCDEGEEFRALTVTLQYGGSETEDETGDVWELDVYDAGGTLVLHEEVRPGRKLTDQDIEERRAQ